jgi:hypothetical protein
MTFLGSGLSILAILFFGATVAGNWLCARVEPGERRAMGVQGPGEVY